MTDEDRAKINADIDATRRVIDLVEPTGYPTKHLYDLLRSLNRVYEEVAEADREDRRKAA